MATSTQGARAIIFVDFLAAVAWSSRSLTSTRSNSTARRRGSLLRSPDDLFEEDREVAQQAYLSVAERIRIEVHHVVANCLRLL